jgi:hypothetical protein
VQVVRTGDGRLKVVLTAGAGAIQSVRFGTDDRPIANASIDLPGVAPDRRAGFLYLPATPPTRLTFFLRPLAGSLATTVPLVVTDGCGAWQTVVGGGPSAF